MFVWLISKGSEFLYKSLNWGRKTISRSWRWGSCLAVGGVNITEDVVTQVRREQMELVEGTWHHWQKKKFHYRHLRCRQESLERATCFRCFASSRGGGGCFHFEDLHKIYLLLFSNIAQKNISCTSVACFTLCKAHVKLAQEDPLLTSLTPPPAVCLLFAAAELH